MCTIRVLSFLEERVVERFLHKHNKYAMYTYSFLFVFMPTLTRVSRHVSPIFVLTLSFWCLFAQLRFFYKKEISRERDHCVGLREERYQLYGLAVDKGGHLVIKVSFLVS